jgi:hypothetical protein
MLRVKHKKSLVIAGLVTGLLSLMQIACVGAGIKSSGERPDWVDGDAGFYPNQQYLVASGSAANAELARDRALGNLSKIFESKIRENSTTRSDTRVNVRDGKETYSKDQRLAQNINIQTDKVIQGARIAETWLDKPVLTYHALAVLDRQQAGNNMRQEMQRLDQETEVELQRSRGERDPLLSMAALNRALTLQQQRQVLQNSLKVIDLRGQGQAAEWNLAELRGQLESSLQSLRIATAVDGDPLGRLDQAVKSAMGNAGFPAVSGAGDYTLVANLDVQDLGMREGWYWLRGKLSVKLLEASGKVRGRKQWPLKVSALQRNDSESRLMTQVSRQLNQELKPAILSFATGVE